MDVAAWLRGLSLERYAAAFRDNAIELEVLPELSEADLEKIGVLLGHRKIMLKAIGAQAAGAAAAGSDCACRTRCRRAAAAHGNVLRSGRLDGVVDAVRP
jgi:hypothetical protein